MVIVHREVVPRYLLLHLRLGYHHAVEIEIALFAKDLAFGKLLSNVSPFAPRQILPEAPFLELALVLSLAAGTVS